MEKTHFWSAQQDGDSYKLTAIAAPDEGIDGTSALTPKGAYTTFRTWHHNQVLRLTRHFDRLEETSRLAGFSITLNRPALKAALRTCLESLPGEVRMRITIDLSDHIGMLYLAIEKLHTPDQKFYAEGIDTLTAQMHRENPKAKLSNFLERASDAREHAGGTYQEIIMFDEAGNLLEGLSSNFYAVQADKLYTAEKGVLSGTTRDFVLKIAAEQNIETILQPVKRSSIAALDEAFITSTSRSILPVRSIDGAILRRQPAPGPLTTRLMKAYEEELTSQLETL